MPPGSGIAFRAVSFGIEQRLDHEHRPAPADRHAGRRRACWLLDVRGTSTVTAPAGWTLIRTDTFTSSLRMHAYWRLATAVRSGDMDLDVLGLPPGGRRDPRVQRRQHRRRRSTPRAAQAAERCLADGDRAVDHHHRCQTRSGRLLRQHGRRDLDGAGGFTERTDLVGTSASQFTSLMTGRRASGRRRARPGRFAATSSASSGNAAQLDRPAAGRWATACQQRTNLRSEPGQPDRSRGHARQPRRRSDRPRRRHRWCTARPTCHRAWPSTPRPA